MLITQQTRETAIVEREVEYEIDDTYWNSLLDGGMSEEDALEEARSQCRAKRIAFAIELVESVATHETDISLD